MSDHPGTGVTGSCDLPGVGAGEQTGVLYGSSLCSGLLAYPSSPLLGFRGRVEGGLAEDNQPSGCSFQKRQLLGERKLRKELGRPHSSGRLPTDLPITL